MELNVIEQPGGLVYVAEAMQLNSSGQLEETLFGITPQQLGKYTARGQKTSIAQFFEIVQNGLILAGSIYQGIERNCYSHDDINADAHKLIYILESTFDAEWEGDRFYGEPKRREAPPGKLFTVLISPNLFIKDYPYIQGWIEHWAWVEKDKQKPNHPVNFDDRYAKILWRKK